MALTNFQQNRFNKLDSIVQGGGSLGQRQQQRYNRLQGMQNGAGGLPNNPVKATGQVQNNVLGAFNNQFGQNVDQMFGPIDFNALPSAPNTQDLAAERQRMEDSLYGKYTRDFDYQKQRDQEALAQNLAERGIGVGSGEAYNNAMKQFNDSWNQRYDDAKSRAVSEGGQEWERNFNIGTSGRANALNEQAFQRTFPMQQLTGLLGLGTSIGNLNLGNRQLKSSNRQARANRRLQRELTQMNNDAAMARLQAQIGAQGGGGGYTPPSAPPPPPGY